MLRTNYAQIHQNPFFKMCIQIEQTELATDTQETCVYADNVEVKEEPLIQTVPALHILV